MTGEMWQRIERLSATENCVTCVLVVICQDRREPLYKRDLYSEPFEAIACDLIGPFQKGRHGCRYVLTSVCLATRWPTAIPLKNIRQVQ